MANTLAKSIAKFVSTLGNPMAIALGYGAYIQWLARTEASYKYLPILFAVGIVAPILSFIFWKVQNKEFTDFDVSNRQKRNSLYRFLFPLFSLFTIIIIVLGFPLKVILPVLALLILIGCSWFLNKKLKVSLHTSFCFLFAYLFYPINVGIGISMFVFGFVVAWSRLVLNRHSPLEVIAGFLLGNVIGGIYILFIWLAC